MTHIIQNINSGTTLILFQQDAMDIKELFFITRSDTHVHAFESYNIRTRRLVPPFSRETAASFLTEAAASSAVLLETGSAITETDEYIIDLCRKSSVPVIIICDEITDSLRTFFIKKGIADIYNERSFQHFPSYLSCTSDSSKHNAAGTVLVLDDTPPVTGILCSILQRFHYRTIVVSSLHDFFKELAGIKNTALLLLNLSTEKFNIHQFIKMAQNEPSIRQAPLIAYKNLDDGIYVQELISGIRKFTNAILSPEELFSLLINIVFRREIAPHIGLLMNSLDFDGFSALSGAPLSQIYYNLGVDLCNEKYIFTEEKITSLHSTLDRICSTLTKAESIKWLAGNNDKRPTCATYV